VSHPTRVEPTKLKAFSTDVRDYPSNMSLWEKESLAAEAVLLRQQRHGYSPRFIFSIPVAPSAT
jgi:hypothetical protein